MTLLPAYGRDYKSKKEIEADFAADKDFVVADISSPWDGKYVNRTQLVESGQKQVNVRYKQQRSVAVIKVQ